LLETDPAHTCSAALPLFEKIDKNLIFGRTAADTIQNLLANEGKDYQKMSTVFAKKIKTLNRIMDSMVRFYEIFDHDTLAAMFGEMKDEKKPGLYLYFEDKVAVNNFGDLERYTRIWDSIVQSFTLLSGEDNPPLEFCKLGKECIMIGVITESKTLGAIMHGITGIVNSLEIVQRIRKIQKEIAHLPLCNDYYELLNDEIESLISSSSITISEELVEKFSSHETEDEDLTLMLSRSLKQILGFVEKGGKVEFLPHPDMPSAEEMNSSLKESFQFLKQNRLMEEANPLMELSEPAVA
jgi:cell fate (sporulation/competence/biofilm development) regulator YmcA (YheA/YmcA/DUF963 family)